jgi:hypothetical protein
MHPLIFVFFRNKRVFLGLCSCSRELIDAMVLLRALWSVRSDRSRGLLRSTIQYLP